MSGVAVAAVGGAVIGGVLQSEGARGAARSAETAQRDAAAMSNNLQREMFETQRADLAPFRGAGYIGLENMQRLAGSGVPLQSFDPNQVKMDPGFQFRLQQGQNAIETSAAARGGLNSGRTLKALTQYGQNLASDEYSNAYNRVYGRFINDRNARMSMRNDEFNRYASLAGLGQVGTTQSNQAAQQYGSQVGQNMIGVGNAAAASQIAQMNAQNQAIGNAVNTGSNWAMYSLMNNKKGG